MSTATDPIQADYSLAVHQLSKSFGKHAVLRDITFKARPGEIVSVVGENGAGKSTLLNIISGMLSCDSGQFEVRGRLGYCPQEPLIFENLTVRENFQYFARAYGLDRRGGPDFWETIMQEMLQQFRFEQYRNWMVSKLSGGTKQKLNLSLALFHSPDLLVLDEPYAAFDWETYLRFWDCTRELRARNKTILIVSHFIYDRSNIDALYELEDGVLQCV